MKYRVIKLRVGEVRYFKNRKTAETFLGTANGEIRMIARVEVS